MCDEAWDLKEIVDNPRAFRALVARTYWYPRRGLDDPRSVYQFNRDNGMSHIISLQELCRKYMTKFNDICTRSTLAATELDKPNMHRLPELYHHSLPALGHVRFFAELVFECAHQPRKRAMARSKFRDSHLQSMKHCLCDDWKQRIAAAYSAEMDEEVTGCFLNMLCGRDEMVWREVMADAGLVNALSTLSRNEIIKKVLGKVPPHLDVRSCTSVWYLTEPSAMELDEDDTLVVQKLSTIRAVEDLIRNYIVDIPTGYPKFYDQARWATVRGTGSSS